MGGVHHDRRPGRTWALSGGLALSPISTFFGLPWMVHLLGAWCLVPALSHPCLPWPSWPVLVWFPPFPPLSSTFHPPPSPAYPFHCECLLPLHCSCFSGLDSLSKWQQRLTGLQLQLLVLSSCLLVGAASPSSLCWVLLLPPLPTPLGHTFHPPLALLARASSTPSLPRRRCGTHPSTHTPHAPLAHIPSPYLAVHSLPVSIFYFYFCPLFLSLAHRPSFFPPSTLRSPSSFPPAALVCDLFVIVVVFWKDKKENSKKKKPTKPKKLSHSLEIRLASFFQPTAQILQGFWKACSPQPLTQLRATATTARKILPPSSERDEIKRNKKESGPIRQQSHCAFCILS
ncbi:hypothetical protein CSIM01_01797 [Colletotrichum simmondsii]|uniref:Uncharacterized protein n=1 Tax=Colletotrichum simmondsii TaxID=703756 RepID=A0A135T4F7_9PEZI|nr:hypothetical protein CSIM01_01797 [Colletotrichum simmondsii]